MRTAVDCGREKNDILLLDARRWPLPLAGPKALSVSELTS